MQPTVAPAADFHPHRSGAGRRVEPVTVAAMLVLAVGKAGPPRAARFTMGRRY
ncbi:hypothetical protein ACIOEW_38045 [Streptomyces sp. NPDC087901]|uniref:hypothetical protein n=1 Tax=Streptomyces sp. NPDC087901 TaxID=3365818 RepID=UPI00382EF645